MATPSSTSTAYSARWLVPELVERGSSGTTIRCRIYRAGQQVAPLSATVDVIRPEGTKLIDAGVATVDASDGTLTYDVGDTSGERLSDGWRFVWRATFQGGERHTFGVDGALVRHRLHCPVTEVDLFARMRALSPATGGRNALASRTDYSEQIDEAWAMVQNWLVSKGDRPWLVLSPVALREPTLHALLALVLDELGARGNPGFSDRAREERVAFRDAMNATTLRYDYDEDGTVDDSDARQSAGVGGVFWTNGLGPDPYGRRR